MKPLRRFPSNRMRLSYLLVRAGRFVESCAPMVLSADDLIEIGKQAYSRSVSDWSRFSWVSSGLDSNEKKWLKEMNPKKGRLLLLGVGGGREAIHLAKAGFSVTGLDIVPEMVASAQANAGSAGVHFEGLVQDFTRLEVPLESYDAAWLSCQTYSCIPTSRRRIEMLQRVRRSLRPGAPFFCHFLFERNPAFPRRERIKLLLARLSFGLCTYEIGDEFLVHCGSIRHRFRSESGLRIEFNAGGFIVEKLEIGKTSGHAILRSPGTLANLERFDTD